MIPRTRQPELQTLSVHDVRKSFGDREVLHGVGLSIEQGEVVALLGPNGAGKTTLSSIIAGMSEPDCGDVRIGTIDLRKDPVRARQLIGYAAQEVSCYPTLTVLRNLTVALDLTSGVAYGRKRRDVVDEIIDGFHLESLLNKRVKDLSGGQQRRVHVAMSMIAGPRMLMLDEATAGVDVEIRRSMIDVIRWIADTGTGVLYSSHYLQEVVELGAVVLILIDGEIRARGFVDDLVREHGVSEVRIGVSGTSTPSSEFMERSDAVLVDGQLRIRGRKVAQDMPAILDRLASEGIGVASIDARPADFESVYLDLIGPDRPGTGKVSGT